uniref:Uncharacterized protein n=1 Tax=Nelumbo nucifera TaxID=4432 RepID=A0A822YAD7_NELNU|nr:TPA_asm: hypothetical protein HUJ06_031008 [Nelumbo nucifera]
MRKSEEYVKKLLDLLKVGCQERDEAQDQLQRLLNNALSLGPTKICIVFPSVTESDSLSETFNHHSHGSSPVDSFIDAISSSELTNMNIVDSSNTGVQHHPFVQECNKLIPMDMVFAGNSGIVSKGSTEVDRASLVIDNLVKGKQLPQKGRLFPIIEVGPLLQTLIVAGPLPQCRNPPPL